MKSDDPPPIFLIEDIVPTNATEAAASALAESVMEGRKVDPSEILQRYFATPKHFWTWARCIHVQSKAVQHRRN